MRSGLGASTVAVGCWLAMGCGGRSTLIDDGAAAMDIELVKVARDRLLKEDWHFAVCLTTLPLRVGRRPVTASASVPLGAGVVSVPAFGAVDLEDRVSQAVLRLVEGLASGDGAYTRRAGARRRSRARRGVRLHEFRDLSSPAGTPHLGDRGTIRFGSFDSSA